MKLERPKNPYDITLKQFKLDSTSHQVQPIKIAFENPDIINIKPQNKIDAINHDYMKPEVFPCSIDDKNSLDANDSTTINMNKARNWRSQPG